MSNTKTPKQILSSLLTFAAEAAEQWATNLSLDTFPNTTWDDPAVQHHPALVGGWLEENWEEYQADCYRWSLLANVTSNCPEVAEEHLRLINAMDVLNTFSAVVEEHTEEFCK